MLGARNSALKVTLVRTAGKVVPVRTVTLAVLQTGGVPANLVTMVNHAS